jgi:hypothetical protein
MPLHPFHSTFTRARHMPWIRDDYATLAGRPAQGRLETRASEAITWNDGTPLATTSSQCIAVLGTPALWLGIQYPTANFWGGQGFGSTWECEILGRRGAKVCLPDVPQPAKNPPPAGPR